MLTNYVPVLMYLCVALGIGLVLLGLGFLIGRGRKYPEKLSAYECGFAPFEDSRMKPSCVMALVAQLSSDISIRPTAAAWKG